MSQSCLACGPDVACLGHPQRKTKPRPIVETATPGKCPICEHMRVEVEHGKHRLGGYYQIGRALKFGPVFALTPSGQGPERTRVEVVVHGVHHGDGALQLDTGLGLIENFDAVWALCSPEPYREAGL